MTTTTDPTPKKRTDWDARLAEACAAWEAANEGRRIAVFEMKYPANPGTVVRIDDKLPHNFTNAKAATLRINAWAEAAKL